MSHQPASRNSAFYWAGKPSEIAPLLGPKPKDSSPEALAKRPKRHENTDDQRIYGLSRKSEEIRRYSPAIEGREAGQRSADKREALRKGTIG